MRVRTIELISNSEEQRLSAQVDFESISRPSYNLWYSFPTNVSVSVRGDAFLAACLFPAMVIEKRLEIEAPVSPQLLSRINQIQDFFIQWNKNARRIPIEAPIEAPDFKQENRVGCYFTMGVDSFYTMLKESKNPERSPDSLIYVHGFDIPLSNEKLYQKVKSNLEKVATSVRKKLILAKSSVRPFGDIQLQWGDHFHGAALASVGLALSQTFKTIYIPATRDSAHLVPWGSHPLLDPLWSNESTTFDHNGSESIRSEKIIKEIIKSDIALEYLRVCFQNPDDSYNCGHCEKCLRTMLVLYAAGALGACKTFNNPLTPELIRSVRFSDFTNYYAEENVRLLAEMPVTIEGEELLKALRLILKKRKATALWEKFRSLWV